ncbi:hypothetical protein [Magnetospirillum fulvum]|nr:hypothetical protein [Magnetospirillum fulvum]
MTAPRWLRRVDWPGLGVDAVMVAMTAFLAPSLATALFIILAARR